MVKSGSGWLLYKAAGVSLPLYAWLAYLVPRFESFQLISGYSVLFGLFMVMWFYARTAKQVRWLLVFAILLRMVLLFAFPGLSDDIYRFVWDGRLFNQNIHPFSHIPSYYMDPGSPDVPGITSSLYYLLNSPNYFTIYPPVAQFFFSVATAIFPASVHGSAIVIRAFIILAECGSIWLITRILFHYKLPAKNALLYALNPLIILELTGNLHFEAFMIFFLLAGTYFFITGKSRMAALSLAFAIASKLLPLMLMPLFIRWLHWKKLLIFYALIAAFTLVLFLPFLHQDLFNGMTASLSLYFQRFEFNASIYYLLREIGFYTEGYNTIHILGKYLALAAFLLIMGYALLHNHKRIRLPEAMLWVLLFYLFLSTTVHPWYISTVLVLSIFTRFRFVILWSFLIFMTYVGYSESGFEEILWLTTTEYVLVFVFMLYEIYKHYIKKGQTQNNEQ
ncbi:hypothetical protein C900_04735 [Fulvivirga imtechensis AK7]|uniref:DUF2029 domain-containing protein n=1 Tax=Fulvivirga imtechensis AK7 TaxID=1237149 RepID=L8JNM9_9BACT|nr:hypothetical protein [Fulvivirga imtechensis]ELR69758.1 hypothetical protein C900_04735 [Fulvivirga imtechensis AK7]